MTIDRSPARKARPRKQSRRRVVAGSAAFLLVGEVALAAVFLTWAGPARAAPQLAVVNGTVDGGADHVQAGSSAFPNFNTGAIDNHYPLAHAHVDSSPFAEGTASPADTGPLGQTAAASAAVKQPQYADARCQTASCPPTATDVGTAGGPFGHASAQANQASGVATAGGTVTDSTGTASSGAAASGSARQDQLDRLWSALGAWRSQFLTAADVARYPAARRDASSPDGTDGDTSVGQASFDPNAGAMTVSGDARADRASFGSGAVVLRGVHTHVSVVNAGTPKANIVNDVANVEVDGVPVVLGQQGLSVNGAQVPGVANTIEAANSALNSALAQGGITVTAVAPKVTNSDNQETVDAAVAQIGIQQPQTAPGVPTQTVRHVLGEVLAESLAVPGEPLTSVGAGGDGSSSTDTGASAGEASQASPGLTGATPGLPGSLALPGTAGTGTAAGSAGPAGGQRAAPTDGQSSVFQPVAATKPSWLLLLYFCWQCLVFGTAASLWWWRKAPAS
jgi:hypothetical protein